MRFIRYRDDNITKLAVLDRDRAAEIVPTSNESPGDMVALIASGTDGLDRGHQALAAARTGTLPWLDHASLCLDAPLRPEIILCTGENYHDHRAEKPKVERKDPEFFIKVPHGVVGPEDDVLLDPLVTSKLDYETELAVVIGCPGRHIAPEQALDHVFGYTILNDLTARDRQVRMRPDGTCTYNLGPGKNFDTCAPMGPSLVTADEMPDPQALGLRTRINGEVRQNNSTANMIWPIREVIAFFSTFLTLKPGFVISTGTPGGTAWGTDPELGARKTTRDDVVPAPGYLKSGDEVSCEIDGIGTLTNHVRATRARP